jgi:hypothetical protein
VRVVVVGVTELDIVKVVGTLYDVDPDALIVVELKSGKVLLSPHAGHWVDEVYEPLSVRS